MNIISVQTSATGANFATFASQACTMMEIINNSGADIEYQRNGTGNTIWIPNNGTRMISGISNASQIGIRRIDQTSTQVTVAAETY